MRYDLKCDSCQFLYTVYMTNDAEVDPNLVPCEECGRKEMRILAYYTDVDTHLNALQDKIDDIQRRLELLEEESGLAVRSNEIDMLLNEPN